MDVYLAPNDVHALACFNQMVSAYWLGQEVAVIVRRPRLLVRDEQGRLHSASGRCLEYHDGWGISAWHGVVVPERVILAPETLTREDFLSEQNVEVRRVIQERMGQRFVPELGGVVLDSGSRGILYEVALPMDDPERVARYVQVQDASTSRITSCAYPQPSRRQPRPSPGVLGCQSRHIFRNMKHEPHQESGRNMNYGPIGPNTPVTTEPAHTDSRAGGRSQVLC